MTAPTPPTATTDNNHPTITRFAPSPTGHLHIGGARTALFCWAFAHRAHGSAGGGEGRFLLRIEDTDQARSSEDAARGILEDLAWLGISWNDGPDYNNLGVTVGGDPRGVGPYYQSQRRDIYDDYFTKLLDEGLAYPAFDTPDELNAMRKAAEAEKKTFIYRRPAGVNHAEAMERAKTEPHVLRLKFPETAITVHDQVLGDVTFPFDELDDFVIRKQDGFPTYHFAVVVDDALMGVTHVLRGQEHLNNTPKHIALQHALGFDIPAFAHLPLIFNLDGTKMSKRDKDKAAKKAVRDGKIDSVSALLATGRDRQPHAVLDLSDADFTGWLKDKQRQLSRDQLSVVANLLDLHLPEIDVEDFRAAGYLPGVLNNFLALLGWNPGIKNPDGTDLERFDNAFLADHFAFDRIGKSPSKFDREKLIAFNADTIQHHMSDNDFANAWLDWAERFDTDLAAWGKADADRWRLAAAAARPRAKTLRDAKDALAFVRTPATELAYDAKAVSKHLLKGEPSGLAVLPETKAALEAIDEWTPDAIEAAIKAFAERTGHGMGKAAQPLRIALTGTAVSPPLGLTLALVGRDDTLARIDRCLSQQFADSPA